MSFLVGPKIYQSLRKRKREVEKNKRRAKDSPTFVPELEMEISLVSFLEHNMCPPPGLLVNP